MRHYDKVAADTLHGFTEPQKYKLSKVCNFEFPQKEKIIVKSDSNWIHSNENEDLCAKAIDSLNKLVIKLSKEERGITNLDSFKKAIIDYYLPPVKKLVIHDSVFITKTDSSEIFAAQYESGLAIMNASRVSGQLEESRKTISSFEENKKSTWNTCKWFFGNLVCEGWFWFVVVLLGAGTAIKLIIKSKTV